MEHKRPLPFARLARGFLASAILLAGTFSAGGAYAADGTGQADADILEQAELINLDDLAFGTVVPGLTGGTVTIDPSNNARSTTGSVAGVASTHHAARFRATGTAGIVVIVTLPGVITITRQGGTETMLVNDFELDGAINLLGLVTINLGPIGQRDLKIGATLNVVPNQTPGAYDGTFQITTTYL